MCYLKEYISRKSHLLSPFFNSTLTSLLAVTSFLADATYKREIVKTNLLKNGPELCNSDEDMVK